MKVTVTYTGKLFDAHKAALKWDGKEKSAWLLCNSSQTGNFVKLLPYEIIIPKETDYVTRTDGYYELKKPFINKVLKKAVAGQFHIIQAHVHPSGIDTFSPVDEKYELMLMRHLNSKINGMYHASLVFSNSMDSIDGWVFDAAQDKLVRIEKVVVVRDNKLELFVPPGSQDNNTKKSRVLYRTIQALGKKTVDILGNLHVGVIGASALGGPVCELLARDRVKAVSICDSDIIDETNLNRLIWATDADIGKSKAEFYRNVIQSISPKTKVSTFKGSFYEPVIQEAFSQVDIIFGCVDSGARLSINRLASANNIPYFDLGAGIEAKEEKTTQITGQVFCVIPGSGVCISCSGAFDRFLDEYMPDKTRQLEINQGYIQGHNNMTVPLIMCLDFIVSGIGYGQMLRYISGLQNKMPFRVHYDGTTNRITAATCEKNNCITCSNEGFTGQGNKVPYMVPREFDVSTIPVA